MQYLHTLCMTWDLEQGDRQKNKDRREKRNTSSERSDSYGSEVSAFCASSIVYCELLLTFFRDYMLQTSHTPLRSASFHTFIPPREKSGFCWYMVYPELWSPSCRSRWLIRIRTPVCHTSDQSSMAEHIVRSIFTAYPRSRGPNYWPNPTFVVIDYVVGKPPAEKYKGTVFLVHGFQDLWYGWRHQIPMILNHGLRVVAIDCMGYGGTVRLHGVFE